jgi:hypothetical protein
MPPMDANLLIVIVRTVRSIGWVYVEINNIDLTCFNMT